MKILKLALTWPLVHTTEDLFKDPTIENESLEVGSGSEEFLVTQFLAKESNILLSDKDVLVDSDPNLDIMSNNDEVTILMTTEAESEMVEEFINDNQINDTEILQELKTDIRNEIIEYRSLKSHEV